MIEIENCSPSDHLPHLFGSAHNLVRLFPLVLLPVLFQLFLLLFKLIPLGFLCLWTCTIQNNPKHLQWPYSSIFRIRMLKTIIINKNKKKHYMPSSEFLWSENFLFLVIFPSVGFWSKNFFLGPPLPAGLVKVFFLSEL